MTKKKLEKMRDDEDDGLNKKFFGQGKKIGKKKLVVYILQ